MHASAFLPASVARLVLILCLFVSGSAHAGLIRYDVNFQGSQLGHMVFDAELGPSSQNLWGSLVDWSFGWDGIFLNAVNSVADADSRFFINALGTVIDDGIETITCTAPGLPFCAPEIVVTGKPGFQAIDGSRIDFYESGILGEGILESADANGGTDTAFGELIYSGPSVVSLPATHLLIIISFMGIGVMRRRRLALLS